MDRQLKKKIKGLQGKSVLAERENARLFRLVYMKALFLLFISSTPISLVKPRTISTNRPSSATNLCWRGAMCCCPVRGIPCRREV